MTKRLTLYNNHKTGKICKRCTCGRKEKEMYITNNIIKVYKKFDSQTFALSEETFIPANTEIQNTNVFPTTSPKVFEIQDIHGNYYYLDHDLRSQHLAGWHDLNGNDSLTKI